MTTEPHPFRRYGPATAMTLLIPALSLLPARFFGHLAAPLPHFSGTDKVVHALMYAALTAAYLHALSGERKAKLAPVLSVAAVATLFGLLMELGQKHLTTSRSMDPFDALANMAGAIVMALFVWAWKRGRGRSA